MTVCVAALCEFDKIIGASDRMLTVGGGAITYEPDRPKTWGLTVSSFAMTAGDDGIQTEVFYELHRLVREYLDGGGLFSIKAVVDFYGAAYCACRRARLEREVLSRVDLTLDSFRTEQQQMHPSFVDRVTGEMLSFEPPAVETLIAGIDADGGHIYAGPGPDLVCHDNLGFAAVGVGAWLASNQFILAEHTRMASFPETLLRVYFAKRHAEAAAGVGRKTEMCSVIGPGKSTAIGSGVVKGLEVLYKKSERAERRLAKKLADEVASFVEDIRKRQTESGQGPEQPTPPITPPL